MLEAVLDFQHILKLLGVSVQDYPFTPFTCVITRRL